MDEAAATTTTTPPARDPEALRDEADAIVMQGVVSAAAVGLVPVPVLDIATVTGVVFNMLRQLSRLYGVPFRKNLVASAVATLIAGVLPYSVAASVGSLFKLVPGLGSVVGGGSVALLSGAMAYATGRVFVEHLESGGTFLDFSPARWRKRFRSLFEEGKAKAAEVNAADASPVAADIAKGDL